MSARILQRCHHWSVAKLFLTIRFKMYLSYFCLPVPTSTIGGIMTFERVCADIAVCQSGSSDINLPKLLIKVTGNMFESPSDVAQVDLSNRSANSDKYITLLTSWVLLN